MIDYFYDMIINCINIIYFFGLLFVLYEGCGFFDVGNCFIGGRFFYMG